MELIDSARQFIEAGRFREALEVLDSISVNRSRTPIAVLRAEILARLGQNSEAWRISEVVLRSKDATIADRASSENTLGRILRDQGDVDGALERLQRSAMIARSLSNNLDPLCWCQIYLFELVADRSGPDAARPLLADARRAVAKLGDPRATAALHIVVGLVEARRGLFDNALRHITIGQRLLADAPNVWLDALAENAQLGIGVLRSDYQNARRHGERAVALAEKAGAATIYGACLANVGATLYGTGDFDCALEHVERAETVLPAGGEKINGVLDLLARIQLSQNRLDACAETLSRIKVSMRSPEDQVLYSHRFSELTRVNLMARSGLNEQALDQVDVVLELAERANDTFLTLLARSTKAELLQQSERMPEAIAILNATCQDLTGQSPELFAQRERILACALVEEGHTSTAKLHYERAERIYAALGSVPERLELERRWRAVVADAPLLELRNGTRQDHGGGILQSAATIILYSDRPEIVACEIIELLCATQCVESASIVSRDPDGLETTLTQVGIIPREADDNSRTRRLGIGVIHKQAMELVVRPKADSESAANVNAIALLLSSVRDLERARLEREQRATLWPIEDLPVDGERAVIMGQMREQMELARRIAQTHVNVLITGESGTGKEILARAIHDFSDRAAKPFVPFNCAAIPRDLLESQLFGHRRGAFTGADRDHAGVIRNARDGTLFLDEIGEMSLDLQPKLLRFLESGEIAPIGEPSLVVNVRIVAATNSNLEDAVRAGRFREDLFYRLHVVRLSLKPLRERRDEIPGLVHHFAARAAREFKKGNVHISEETMERLLLYRWPGNVRQLQNELRRMMALAEPDSTLGPEAISEQILGGLPLMRSAANSREIAISLDDKLLPTLARIEAEMIKAALAQHHGKVDAVAKALGISRKGLYLKRQRLGL